VESSGKCDNLLWPEFGVAELGLRVNKTVRLEDLLIESGDRV
jgi:hypothetical protein